MSVVDYVRPECTDISGHGYDLQSPVALGNVLFGYTPVGIEPSAFFSGGVAGYLVRAAAVGNWASILGTEAYMAATLRGLTIGGWFWWTALPGAAQYLMAKDDGANRSYFINLQAANTIQIGVWPGPVFHTTVATINVGWNHITGIYDQSSQTLFIELNGAITAGGAGAAPAALADSAAPFTIGADGAGGNRFAGYASDCFLAALSLRHGFVKAGFHYTKAAFGVK